MAFGYKVDFMLMIRFQRVGRKDDPACRVVVTEKRSKPNSGELEILGSYHPKTKATILKGERILYWLSKGAKASPTVHNLLVSKGVVKGDKINIIKVKPAAESEKPAPTADAVKNGGVEPAPEVLPEPAEQIAVPEASKEEVPTAT